MFLYFLIFGEMALSSPDIKKFLIFSQKKAFLIFRKTVTPQKFLIFQKPELLLYFRKGKPWKTSYFSGRNFPSSKKWKNPTLKICLILREMEISSPKLKKLLIFQERTYKTWKRETPYICFHIFCLLGEKFLIICAKAKSFLYFSLERSKTF